MIKFLLYSNICVIFTRGFIFRQTYMMKYVIKLKHHSLYGCCKRLSYMDETFINVVKTKFDEVQRRDIWEESRWSYISNIENDDVGKAGEKAIQEFCNNSGIPAMIDGLTTKESGGGMGDGIINGCSVEIKTARLGSGSPSFQHELGEVPWKAEYMLFLDVSPSTFYVTIFPNFSEEFYKKSGTDNSVKCNPIFPTKSICWRKGAGAFKLDTTVKLNEKNIYTFCWNPERKWEEFAAFVNKIITPKTES